MKLRPFQIALLIGFAVIAVISLIVLSQHQATPDAEERAYGDSVTIWGTLDAAIVRRQFQNISAVDKAFNAVKYFEIDQRDFDSQLVNAIAEGRSPDMIILSSDNLVKHRAKLLPFSYKTIPRRDYKSAYVDGAEIFALRDGVYAVPFAVDPLVLYWNRDLFASNGLVQAPQTWEEVTADVVPTITVTDTSRDISQSGIAFGEFRNVTHAKDVLMMLAMQSGSELVVENERGDYDVHINRSTVEDARMPMDAALQFYTIFSNSNSPTYSWNRAQAQDTNAFIAGDLAMYFGYGSEAEGIDLKNPNLNFDIAPVPQGGSLPAQRTIGTFYGFAVPRASGNIPGAFAAMNTIASAEHADPLTTALNIAPVRRDLIAASDSNFYRAVMLKSALIARAWLDPDSSASDTVFMQMVEAVVSNRSRVNEAVTDAINRLVLKY